MTAKKIMNELKRLDHLPENIMGKLIVFDGNKCATLKEYFNSISEQLSFPTKQNNWDSYLDWMRDLSWIEENDITVLIINFQFFLSDENDRESVIETWMSDFSEVIFPFWRTDAKSVFNNESFIKTIHVYLVDTYSFSLDFISTENLLSDISYNSVFGRKTPYSISAPVLKYSGSHFCIAAYILFYSRKDLIDQKMRYPSLYVLADLKSGKIIDRITNTNVKSGMFSIAFTKRNMSYWESTYLLFDLIRNEIIRTGIFRKDMYSEYLRRNQETTPTEFWDFFLELSG